MKNFKVLEHSLISHYLTVLRDKNTLKPQFKFALDRISFLLAADIYSRLEISTKRINTPLKSFSGSAIKNKIVLMPVLRAGLGFMQGFTELYPEAAVSHIGVYRDEKTLLPVNYYFKFPELKDKKNLLVIILEPMIATGGSAIFAAKVLNELGVRRIHIASLISAPEGIKAIGKAFNNKELETISLTTCSLDEKLNSNGYIVPGLGDAGDRMFGT